MEVRVERVARAICEADDEPWEELPDDDNGTLLSFPNDRNHYRKLARAAIAADICADIDEEIIAKPQKLEFRVYGDAKRVYPSEEAAREHLR